MKNSAQILSQKIKAVYPEFDAQRYCEQIAESTPKLGYSQRILAHANALNELLPPDFVRGGDFGRDFRRRKPERNGHI